MICKFVSFIGIIFLFLISSCTKKPIGSEYFPFSENGKSEYSVQYITAGSGIHNGTMIVRADGKENIDGKEYIKKVEVFSGLPGQEPSFSYYRFSENGVYKVNGKHKERHEYLSTPYPLEIGTKWTVQEPEGEFHYNVDAKESVEISNVKYDDCLKITFSAKINSVPIEGVSYLARDIGIVKNTVKYPNLTIELILDKYSK